MSKKTIRVLMIEDTALQVRTAKHMLSSADRIHFEVEWTSNLADGLRMMAEQEFDVVLSDMQLHDSYGVGTLHRLQNQSQAIPIVLLTNLDDEVLQMEALSSGAQDYLIKSQISPHGLIRALDHAIERHKLFTEMRMGYEDRIASLTAK